MYCLIFVQFLSVSRYFGVKIVPKLSNYRPLEEKTEAIFINGTTCKERIFNICFLNHLICKKNHYILNSYVHRKKLSLLSYFLGDPQKINVWKVTLGNHTIEQN